MHQDGDKSLPGRLRVSNGYAVTPPLLLVQAGHSHDLTGFP
jgi:hypothetical protein